MKKKLIAMMLAIAMVIALCSCTSAPQITQEEYDAISAKLEEAESKVSKLESELASAKQDASKYAAVQQEKDELQAEYSALESEYNALLVRSSAYFAAEEEEQKKAGTFNEDTVLSQLSVVEYKYSTRYYHYLFLEITNNSEYNLDVSANVKFYNGDALIGADQESQEAFEAGTQTLLVLSADEPFTKTEYELEADYEDYYKCVVSNLSYESVPAKKKEVVTMKNNGEITADYAYGTMLFFAGDTVVDFDYTYFTDDDSELKPGKSITKELSCSEPYTSVKFYMTGRNSD